MSKLGRFARTMTDHTNTMSKRLLASGPYYPPLLPTLGLGGSNIGVSPDILDIMLVTSIYNITTTTDYDLLSPCAPC